MATAAYFDWDERLFAKRNKEYGAYVLRKNYVQRTLRALLIGISLVVIGVAFPFVKAYIQAKLEGLARAKKKTVITELIEPPPINKEKEPPPPPAAEPPPPPQRAQIQFVPPQIVKR